VLFTALQLTCFSDKNNAVCCYVEGPVNEQITSSLSSGSVAAIVSVIVLLIVVLAVVALCWRRCHTVKVGWWWWWWWWWWWCHVMLL